MIMSRCRGLKHLEECVNLEYLYEWGGPSVRDAILMALNDIQERAERRFWKYGSMNVLLPELHAKPNIIEFIFIELTKRFPIPSCIGVKMQEEQQFREDLMVKFVPFSEKKSKNAIPVGWNDDLPDWTWTDVVNDGGRHYATSSKITWPPEEYVLKAQRFAPARVYKRRPEY